MEAEGFIQRKFMIAPLVRSEPERPAIGFGEIAVRNALPRKGLTDGQRFKGDPLTTQHALRKNKAILGRP